MKMKRVFALIWVAGVLLTMGCGSKKDSDETQEEDDAYEIAAPAKKSSEELIAEGKQLVDGSDCRTCHHPTNKVIGPAHAEVAKKYEFTEANVKMLAEKIINGGSGVWGEIMMNPHPDLSQADAEKMARYVLSLDGEKEK